MFFPRGGTASNDGRSQNRNEIKKIRAEMRLVPDGKSQVLIVPFRHLNRYEIVAGRDDHE